MSAEKFNFNVYVGDVAADSDGKQKGIYRADRAMHIDTAYLSAETAIAAADTNYQTYALVNGTTTIASMATGPESGGSSLAAGVPLVFSTMTGGDLASGDALTLEPTKTGSGLIGYGMSVAFSGYYTD